MALTDGGQRKYKNSVHMQYVHSQLTAVLQLLHESGEENTIDCCKFRIEQLLQITTLG